MRDLFWLMKCDLPSANRLIAEHSRGRGRVHGDIRKLHQGGKFSGNEFRRFTFRIHFTIGPDDSM